MNNHTINAMILCFAMVAVMFLSACSSWKADRAPFYVYNNSLLNEDVSTNYQPRRPDPYRNTYLATQTPRSRPDTRVASASERRSDGPGPDARKRPVASKVKQKAKSSAKAKAPVASKVKQKAKSKRANKKSLPPKGNSRFNPQHSAAYLKTIYEANGIKLGKMKGNDAVATLYAQTKKQGTVYHATRPAIGDLVFFHNTFDRNGDGRNNDWYTHAGLVEGVDEDGTIYVLSYWDGKVQSFPINLEHPRIGTDDRNKKVWNTVLRNKADDDPAFTQYLGGELFAGFGSLLGERTELVVVDDWKP